MRPTSSKHHVGSSRGSARVEWAIAAGLVLLLGGAMTFAALFARRVSRDAGQVSRVRQAQAALEAYRLERSGYPAANDADAPVGFGYRPTPEGCAPATDAPCLGYEIAFTLEGSLGGLTGGSCIATRESISCASAR